MDMELVTDPDACMMYTVYRTCHHLQAWARAYCGGLPPFSSALHATDRHVST